MLIRFLLKFNLEKKIAFQQTVWWWAEMRKMDGNLTFDGSSSIVQCGGPQTLCLLVYKAHEYYSYKMLEDVINHRNIEL